MGDKKRMIEGLAQSQEDKILLARVYERLQSGAQKSMPVSTCFLSPREQALVAQMFQPDLVQFWGGWAEAERRICVYVPEYLEEQDFLFGEDAPVVALRATYFPGDDITHRDFLGSLMGEGIKREVIGDILVGKGRSDLLVSREIALYLLQNWLSAGRTKFSLTQIPLEDVEIPVVKTTEARGTVATLRLDGVVAEGFSISRSKASAYITGGKVTINGLLCEKTDKQVAEGDTIALRGMGKICLLEVGNLTKKGRISLQIRKFQ